MVIDDCKKKVNLFFMATPNLKAPQILSLVDDLWTGLLHAYECQSFLSSGTCSYVKAD